MRFTRYALKRKSLGLIGCLFALTARVTLSQAQGNDAQEKVPHLEIARQLVRDLQQQALINKYGSHPTFIHWSHPTREARTVCATFITRLFEHTYGWNKDYIERWLGANGADASTWYDTIAHSNGFRLLKKIGDVRPGDILAIKYNDDSEDTGHVMVVNREPQRIEPTAPVERGTEQYRVEVIDSSASGHGPADTRHKADGGFTGGIGKGTIRVYADREGTIVGYTWSETKKSKFYRSPARDLVAGRWFSSVQGLKTPVWTKQASCGRTP